MDSFDWKHLLAEGIIMAKVVNVLYATMASDYLGFFCYQIIQENPSKPTCNAKCNVCVCVGGGDFQTLNLGFPGHFDRF